MKKGLHFKAWALLTALGLVLMGVSVVQAQVKKGKSRPLQTSHLMKGVVKPHCEALKKGLEGGPTTDEAWDGLAVHAALLNEASYCLMEDGRCPDGVWADAASKTLREGSVEVLKAIHNKDVAAAKAGFANMTKSCKGCHEKHKEK
jgi:cytochrome c556